MPFKYPFTVFKGSFFVAFLKQMYTVSDFCKDPSPTSKQGVDAFSRQIDAILRQIQV